MRNAYHLNNKIYKGCNIHSRVREEICTQIQVEVNSSSAKIMDILCYSDCYYGSANFLYGSKKYSVQQYLNIL